MKTLFTSAILILILVLSTPNEANCQMSFDSTTNKFSVSKVLEFNGYSKDSLFALSNQFLRTNGNKLFYMNDNAQKYPKWAEIRARWSDKDFVAPGYYSEIRDKNIVLGKAIFCYKGAREGCIQFLTITADLIIMNKEGKSRIEFTNFSYTHKNIGAPPVYINVGGFGSGYCDNAGSIEKLFLSKVCPKVFDAIGNFINDRSNEFIDDFSKNLKGAPISKNIEAEVKKSYEKEW